MQEFKFKPLSKSQILISIDRLTRFKQTEEKYLRVFKDILVSNLISPKLKKSQIDLLDYSEIIKLAQEIINSSISNFGIDLSSDFDINNELKKYENSVFMLDENAQILLDNQIEYFSAIKLFDYNELPLNLKWLSFLTDSKNQTKFREKNSLRFPLEKIIIVEGITEEILLPRFAKLLGYDFDKYGINLISAGGKNQVVKMFYSFSNILKLPIFVLLDSDATDNYSQIVPKLRDFDKIYVIEKGEFEDILPLNLIKRTLNNYLKNFSSVCLDELKTDGSMCKILEDIFKQKGFGEFKKAEFASLVAQNIASEKDISDEIFNIITEIKQMSN